MTIRTSLYYIFFSETKNRITSDFLKWMVRLQARWSTHSVAKMFVARTIEKIKLLVPSSQIPAGDPGAAAAAPETPKKASAPESGGSTSRIDALYAKGKERGRKVLERPLEEECSFKPKTGRSPKRGAGEKDVVSRLSEQARSR